MHPAEPCGPGTQGDGQAGLLRTRPISAAAHGFLSRQVTERRGTQFPLQNHRACKPVHCGCFCAAARLRIHTRKGLSLLPTEPRGLGLHTEGPFAPTPGTCFPDGLCFLGLPLCPSLHYHAVWERRF